MEVSEVKPVQLLFMVNKTDRSLQFAVYLPYRVSPCSFAACTSIFTPTVIIISVLTMGLSLSSEYGAGGSSKMRW